jgi:electron transfer flavoprotein beta subunit
MDGPGKSGDRPLRIVTCIKQVPKAGQLQVDPVTKTLKRTGVPSEINPPDLNALELGLRLRDAVGGEAVVVSMGPPSFEMALEHALGMGYDRAILLTDRLLGGSDTVPTALALSRVVEKLGTYDVILCGEETTDSSTGHVGPGIAGHLDIAQVSYVTDASVADGRIRARRAVEDGWEVWEAPMPVLLTVNFLSNRPREPTLTGKIRIKRGGLITHWSAADVGLKPEEIGLRGSPTIVAKVETVRLPERGGRIFRGGVAEAVSQLLDALEADGAVTL